MPLTNSASAPIADSAGLSRRRPTPYAGPLVGCVLGRRARLRRPAIGSLRSQALTPLRTVKPFGAKGTSAIARTPVLPVARSPPNGDVHACDLQRPPSDQLWPSGRGRLPRNLRHYHPRHFRTKPANTVSANDKIGWIENMALDEIKHRSINLRPLRLH
jgi:hypothetical protein